MRRACIFEPNELAEGGGGGGGGGGEDDPPIVAPALISSWKTYGVFDSPPAFEAEGDYENPVEYDFEIFSKSNPAHRILVEMNPISLGGSTINFSAKIEVNVTGELLNTTGGGDRLSGFKVRLKTPFESDWHNVSLDAEHLVSGLHNISNFEFDHDVDGSGSAGSITFEVAGITDNVGGYYSNMYSWVYGVKMTIGHIYAS